MFTVLFNLYDLERSSKSTNNSTKIKIKKKVQKSQSKYIQIIYRKDIERTTKTSNGKASHFKIVVRVRVS